MPLADEPGAEDIPIKPNTPDNDSFFDIEGIDFNLTAEHLKSALVTNRTQADVKAKNDKGTYNYTDLNRVLRACAWVAERIEYYGHTIPFEYYKAFLAAVKAQPVHGGIVQGALGYSGETVTVTAKPAAEYEFNGWIENGLIASLDMEYSFTAEKDRDLTAMFTAISEETGFIPYGETETMLTVDMQEFIVKR